MIKKTGIGKIQIILGALIIISSIVGLIFLLPSGFNNQSLDNYNLLVNSFSEIENLTVSNETMVLLQYEVSDLYIQNAYNIHNFNSIKKFELMLGLLLGIILFGQGISNLMGEKK